MSLQASGGQPMLLPLALDFVSLRGREMNGQRKDAAAQVMETRKSTVVSF